MGSGNSYAFGLWELIFPLGFGQEGGPGGPQGPKGTFNTLRLVGRKLLSNIIAAVVAFLAAVIGFLAAVIGFLAGQPDLRNGRFLMRISLKINDTRAPTSQSSKEYEFSEPKEYEFPKPKEYEFPEPKEYEFPGPKEYGLPGPKEYEV